MAIYPGGVTAYRLSYLPRLEKLVVLAGASISRAPCDQSTGPQLEQVSIPGLDEELFPKVLFLRIAQDLRRRIRVPSAELNINETLEKSVQRGGWFTPVYSYRQVFP